MLILCSEVIDSDLLHGEDCSEGGLVVRPIHRGDDVLPRAKGNLGGPFGLRSISDFSCCTTPVAMPRLLPEEVLDRSNPEDGPDVDGGPLLQLEISASDMFSLEFFYTLRGYFTADNLSEVVVRWPGVYALARQWVLGFRPVPGPQRRL